MTTNYCTCQNREYPREFVWRKANWSSALAPQDIMVHSRCDRPVYSSMGKGVLVTKPYSRRWTSHRAQRKGPVNQSRAQA